MTPPDDPAMRRKMCPGCHKPIASEAEWECIPEGEGEWLCWAGGDCDVDPDGLIAAARAEGKREGLEEAAGLDKSEIPGWMDTPMATGWVRGRAELRAAIRDRIEETT